MKISLDVNNPEGRELFLRRTFPRSLEALNPSAAPLWGRMTSQQMVEHLLWAVEVSTGCVVVDCGTASELLPRFKRFLHDNRPTPHEFQNPALAAGLPQLRYGSTAESKSALDAEMERFLNQAYSSGPHTHPIFGPIGHEEWHRSHYKHAIHHLLQFGLIEVEEAATVR